MDNRIIIGAIVIIVIITLIVMFLMNSNKSKWTSDQYNTIKDMVKNSKFAGKLILGDCITIDKSVTCITDNLQRTFSYKDIYDQLSLSELSPKTIQIYGSCCINGANDCFSPLPSKSDWTKTQIDDFRNIIKSTSKKLCSDDAYECVLDYIVLKYKYDQAYSWVSGSPPFVYPDDVQLRFTMCGAANCSYM